MPNNDVIVASNLGTLSDLTLSLDYLMCVFCTAKASQSTIYRGNIVSLLKILQDHGNDPVKVREGIESALYTFLSKYIEFVQVDVRVVPTVYPSIELQINLIVSRGDSNRLDGGYLLRSTNSDFKRLVSNLSGRTLIDNA